jgi:hypothetical protein
MLQVCIHVSTFLQSTPHDSVAHDFCILDRFIEFTHTSVLANLQLCDQSILRKFNVFRKKEKTQKSIADTGT